MLVLILYNGVLMWSVLPTFVEEPVASHIQGQRVISGKVVLNTGKSTGNLTVVVHFGIFYH